MFLMNYDNKCLVEFKTGLRVELPDYVTYSSVVVGSSHRGGTVVCIRNSLADQIRSVDVCTGDQVWLQCSLKLCRVFWCIFVTFYQVILHITLIHLLQL